MIELWLIRVIHGRLFFVARDSVGWWFDIGRLMLKLVSLSLFGLFVRSFVRSSVEFVVDYVVEFVVDCVSDRSLDSLDALLGGQAVMDESIQLLSLLSVLLVWSLFRYCLEWCNWFVIDL